MSIKIYKAWRVGGVRTLSAVSRLVDEIRPKLKEKLHTLLRAFVVTAGVNTPELTLGQVYRQKIYSTAWDSGGMFNPEYQMVFTPTRGGVLVQTFSPGMFDRVYDEVLEEDPRFVQWGYWNNVDPDDSVTRARWERRERDWLEILDHEGRYPSPSSYGFTIDVIHKYDLPLCDELWPDHHGEIKSGDLENQKSKS